MSKCGAYTVSEVTERYCINQFNEARRGFDNYIILAQDSWDEIRRKTLWEFSTVWLPVFKGTPHPYVVLPSNMEMFLGLYEEDACAKLIPVLKSDAYSLLPKPKIKACGCKSNCNCGELCAEANSFTYITRDHIINDILYVEKEWMETCPNGDVIRWREIPSLNETGEVEVVSHQERICKLETLPCGCVADSAVNKSILTEYCGCRFEVCRSTGIYRPQPNECKTVAQADDCGRIHIIGGNVKDWYAAQIKESGSGKNTLIPAFAEKAVKAGIDFYSKIFNPRTTRTDRKDAKYFYAECCQEIVEELNPIDLEFIYRLQGEARKLP